MHPARPPPPSRSHRPVRCRGDGTLRTRGKRDAQQTSNPNRGWGDEPLKAPPPQAGRDSTSPGHEHWPTNRPGQCATGLPTLVVTRPNRRDAEDAPQQRGHDAGEPGADEEMTEASGPQESGGCLLTTAFRPMSPQEPSTGSLPEGHPNKAPGHPSPTGPTPDQDQETMPPVPPRPPQRRNTDLCDGEELRAIHEIHANTPPWELVAALRRQLQDVNPNRRFAVVPLPHAASFDISVRQLQALVIPGMQIADDLVDAWIWRFNFNQPNQGGVWVPHLGWAHMLIAPPTEPRPAPSTGARERAAPQPRANALNTPPYNGVADWESRTAPDRGRNLRDMEEQYPSGAETARAGPPRREDDPSTIPMIVFESGHYYQVRITPHPHECHWNLEAVDSMLPASAALPGGPTPLPQNQPPDPLMAVVSGEPAAGTRGMPSTAAGDGLSTAGCTPRTGRGRRDFASSADSNWPPSPKHERTRETPATANLCPVFAIHQIRALALGQQLLPTIRTETEAQAAHTALVHEIFCALRSALVRRLGNPLGP